MTRHNTRTCRPEGEGVTSSFTELAMHAPRFPVISDPVLSMPEKTRSRRRQRTAIYDHHSPSRESCDKTSFDEIQFDNEWLISYNFEKTDSDSPKRSRGSAGSSGSSHHRHSLQKFSRRGERKEPTLKDRTLSDRQEKLTSKCMKYQITF